VLFYFSYYPSQTKKASEQMARFDKLLERWGKQADRYDLLLEKWEKQAAKSKGGSGNSRDIIQFSE
jgi:hypothetical protein